jgi:hypothetical protein
MFETFNREADISKSCIVQNKKVCSTTRNRSPPGPRTHIAFTENDKWVPEIVGVVTQLYVTRTQIQYELLLSAFLLHVKELPLEQHAFFAPIPKLSELETFLAHRSAASRWNDFVTWVRKSTAARIGWTTASLNISCGK